MKLLICTQAVDKNHPILGFFHGWVIEFSKHFDEVHVICLQEGVHNLPPHVFIHSLGKEEGENRLKYTWRFYRYFAHIFFGLRSDYVLFHMGAVFDVLAAPFFLLRKFYGTKFYWWKAHGHTTLLEKLALQFVDRVYTTIDSSFSVATKKKRVIGHAIDTDLFAPNTSVIKGTHALFVGRIMPVKRLEIVVDFARLTGVPVQIAGPVGDMVYLQKIQQKIEEHGLSSQIKFVGSQSQEELVRAYQEAFVVVNPSETGGVDKVVIEAMACGTPVLALDSTYGGILGQFGLTVEDNSGEAYQKAYAQLKSGDIAYEVVSNALRKDAVANHSLSTLNRRIFGIE